MTLTTEQNRRIAQSINETIRLLGKEKAYLPVNQNAARIAEYEAHLAKLWQMVAA
jgi:hypothetical protein